MPTRAACRSSKAASPPRSSAIRYSSMAYADATASRSPRRRLISAEARLRCHSPMSHSPVTPRLGEAVELLVRHVGEGRHGPSVARRELLEPDVASTSP